MRVQFYGVRGSIATAGDDTRRYGGNTSCVVVEAGGETIILDAGTGIRAAGTDLMKAQGAGKVQAHLFFSHLHWDHIQGFPFFTPAFVPGNRIGVYGVRPTDPVDAGDHDPPTLELNVDALDADPRDGVRAAMANQMRAPNFPVGLEAMRADLRFVDVGAGEPVVLSPFVTVQHVAVDHPNGCVAWRIEAEGKRVVYATDLELADGVVGVVFKQLVELCRDADVLIFDAMYTPEEYAGTAQAHAVGVAAGSLFPRKGWGHSTYEMGAAVADAANVKTLALFHHDPAHDDHFMDALWARARDRRPETIVAREGLELTL